MIYTIKYNGRTASEYNLFVAKRPDIPSSTENVTEYKVPYRDGNLYRHEGTFKNIEIKITFNYVSAPELWETVRRESTRWLYDKEDMRLFLGDDDGWFYKVKKVVVSECKRKYRQTGSFTATFECEGFAYSLEGQNETSELSFCNLHSESQPIYRITGEGTCEINVNGKVMSANVGQNLVIDTGKKIAYRQDGTMMNTSVTGDYENLYFPHGNISVSITPGFTLAIIPQWRCRT